MSIVVRAAEPDDYDSFREVMSQPRAQRMTLQLPLPSRELWRKRLAETPPGDHVLVAEWDGKVVGNLGLHAAAKSPRRRHAGALGMSVHDSFQRRGIGNALMVAALDLADNWLQYTRLELEVYTDNEPAIALYKKFGFEIEGTLRRHAFRQGEFVDSHIMARLKKL
jgi:L-phenylalanine/L-methionine N-acetyltransferase